VPEPGAPLVEDGDARDRRGCGESRAPMTPLERCHRRREPRLRGPRSTGTERDLAAPARRAPGEREPITLPAARAVGKAARRRAAVRRARPAELGSPYRQAEHDSLAALADQAATRELERRAMVAAPVRPRRLAHEARVPGGASAIREEPRGPPEAHARGAADERRRGRSLARGGGAHAPAPGAARDDVERARECRRAPLPIDGNASSALVPDAVLAGIAREGATSRHAPRTGARGDDRPRSREPEPGLAIGPPAHREAPGDRRVAVRFGRGLAGSFERIVRARARRFLDP